MNCKSKICSLLYYWALPCSLLLHYYSVRNTKKLIVFALLVCPLFSQAQKIQVKKGVLSKDEEAIAKLEGEATFGKGTDVTIKSMTDEPLIRVKSMIINYHNVFYQSIQFYKIDFISLNKSGSLTIEYPYSSEKKLVEYLYATIGSDFLGKGGLNSIQINNFLSSKDESDKISADTVRTYAIRNNERERLKRPVEVREISAAILFRKIDSRASNSSTQESFEVFQANKLIAKITKTITSSAIAPGATPTKSASYVVWRKVEPFSVDEKTFEFAHIAAVNAIPNFPLEITAYCERAWAKDLKLSDIVTSELQIISWLIEKGCL